MDTMGALALATEDPNPDLLNDKVCKRDRPPLSLRQPPAPTVHDSSLRLSAHEPAGLQLRSCGDVCAGLQLHVAQKRGQQMQPLPVPKIRTCADYDVMLFAAASWP